MVSLTVHASGCASLLLYFLLYGEAVYLLAQVGS